MNVTPVMSIIVLTCSLQIFDEKKKPEVLVDGWNVYFFDDLKTLVRLFTVFHYCQRTFSGERPSTTPEIWLKR